jgi:hypothetical protein
MKAQAVIDPSPDHAWTGSRYVDVLNPTTDDVNLYEIATGLSREQRYGGASTCVFWSVAQHTLLGDDLICAEGHADAFNLRRDFLLHDAPEYLLRDMIRPVKRNLPDYGRLEEVWTDVIRRRFGLPNEPHPLVKGYDDLACSVEKRWLISPRAGRWPGLPPHADHRIRHWLFHGTPEAVRDEFLTRADFLGIA